MPTSCLTLEKPFVLFALFSYRYARVTELFNKSAFCDIIIASANEWIDYALSVGTPRLYEHAH